jgi:hypothetical protein
MFFPHEFWWTGHQLAEAKKIHRPNFGSSELPNFQLNNRTLSRAFSLYTVEELWEASKYYTAKETSTSPP